jgi:hypothetical protein
MEKPAAAAWADQRWNADPQRKTECWRISVPGFFKWLQQNSLKPILDRLKEEGAMGRSPPAIW